MSDVATESSLTEPPFAELAAVGHELPVLVSIPHTGTRLPKGFARRLASDAMRSLPMTDWHLHLLYDFLPAMGITVLHAIYNRFVVDLNRPPAPAPLYPGRFESGLVALETFGGEPIFLEPPDSAEIEMLRQQYHAPYHAQLDKLIQLKLERFEQIVLIDAHSIASFANQIHDELKDDIYLGDRDGSSCDAWLTELLDGAFSVQQLRVVRNAPYKGGYITNHYGANPRVHAIQIEMCQRVYMDEHAPENGPQHPRFAQTRQMLRKVFELLAERAVI